MELVSAGVQGTPGLNVVLNFPRVNLCITSNVYSTGFVYTVVTQIFLLK